MIRTIGVLGLLLVASAEMLQAQNIISVPFARGFFGVRSSSAGTADSVKTFATLGIARIFFIQNSSTTSFQLQGNDVPGTLRIVKSDGSLIDMPALVNWRNNGGTSNLIGILPQPTSPVTLATPSGTYTIRDGGSTGGTSIGGYFNGYAGPYLTDGSSISGNAATRQALDALNAYLAELLANRPAGPVTVNALTTADNTPVISGTVTLAAGESLSVIVNGVQYSASTSPALVVSGTTWSLSLTSPLTTGSYSVTATITDSDGYTLSDTTASELVIAAGNATVGGSFTANNKVYDGSTAATGTMSGLALAGISAGDTVQIASATIAFQTAAVGNGKTVVVTSVTLSGPQAALYTVSLTGSPTTTANVMPKPLTVSGSFTAANKVHDGTTAATITANSLTLIGVVGSDAVALSASVATFANATVGTAKTVSLTSSTLTGAAAGNYVLSLTGAPTTTANITAAGSTVTISGAFTANNKVYDGNGTATGNTGALTLAGIVAGDTVVINSVTLAFRDAAVANGKTVEITSVTLGGPQAALYAVNLTGAPTTTANITPKPLTVGGSFTVANKVHDGTTAATITANSLTLIGVIGSDVVALSASVATFADATIGTAKTVSLTSSTLTGAAAGNYALSLTGAPTTTANITAAGGTVTITGSFTANNKVYDGTTTATGNTGALTLAGVSGGDDLRIASVTLAFQEPDVGTGKLVSITGVTLAGADAARYTISLAGAPTALANITPKAITIGGSFTAAHKVFDGSTVATITSNTLSLNGTIPRDGITIGSVTAQFADAGVGTAKLVSLSALTLAGTGAGNYTVTFPGSPTTTANITTVGGTVTIAGTFTANDKEYDATRNATGAAAGLTLVGVSGTDDVRIGAVTFAFGSAAVGTGKAVSIAAVTLVGTDAAMYAVNLAGAPAAAATIRPRTVNLTGAPSAEDKLYDGNTDAVLSTTGLALTGVIAGDDVRIVTAQGRFTDPLVGSGKTVRLQGATLGGTAASNYVLQIATPLATRASIQSRPLFLSGSFEAEHKLHDGTTKAVIRSHTLALGWVAPTDNIQFVGFTAEFEDANVGNDKVVYLRGGTISGTGAANYHLGERLTRPTANANILPTTPPSAPRKVTGTIVDGRLQLTWELPADEGCREVTGYLVELSTDDGASWTRRTLEGRTALATALQGLELNVRHRVRVASVNVCGTSDWAEVVGSLIPVAPIATPSGIPSPINGVIGGTAAGTTAGRTTFSVEADSLLSVLSGKATLALKGTDEKGESLPVDSTGVLLLEQGGHVLSSGSGFAPGTVATLYLFGVNGAPSLLATVPIKADGTFDLRGLLAADLPPARYVIQVNGRAADRTLLSISMLVEVAEPPAELVFTSVPSVNEPTVGDTITLTLTVTNSTDGAATDVVIPRAFDERGFKLVRARAEQGTYDEAKREWTISRIGAHAQARLVLTVIVLHTDLNGSVGR